MANALKKAKKELRQTAKALRADRMADYEYSADVIDKLYASLTKQLGRFDRKLDAASLRTIERMRALRARARANVAATEKFEGKVVDKYGGALSGVVGQMMQPTEAIAKASAAEMGARTEAAKKQGKTIETVLGIAQAGAQEAEAAAEHELAQALALRTKDDLALVAQMRHDITMAKLQHQFQMQEMKMQQQLAYKYQMKTQNALLAQQNGPQMLQIVESLASIVPEVRSYAAANPDASVADIVNYLVQNDLVDATQASIVRSLVVNLQREGVLRGTGAPGEGYPAIDAILAWVAATYPNDWKKNRKELEAAIRAALNLAYLASIQSATPTAGSGLSTMLVGTYED